MRKLVIALLLVAFTTWPTFAIDFQHEWTTEEIAQLPQDRVKKIQKFCAKRYPDDLAFRWGCEENQYSALKALIERGSIPQEGEK